MTDKLEREVSLDFPAGIQAIAALDDRIERLRSLNSDGDIDYAIIASLRAILALRVAFRLPAPTEAQLDAAHEAAMAEFRELRDAEDDVPMALVSYWERGA